MYRRNMYISHTTFTYFICDFKYLPEICLSHIACTIGRAGQARSRLYFSFVFPFSFSLLNFFFGGYGEKERRGPHYDRFCGLWSWKKRILEKLPPLLRQRWSRIHGPRAECSGRANKRQQTNTLVYTLDNREAKQTTERWAQERRKRKNSQSIPCQGLLPPWLSLPLCFILIPKRPQGNSRCLRGLSLIALLLGIHFTFLPSYPKPFLLISRLAPFPSPSPESPPTISHRMWVSFFHSLHSLKRCSLVFLPFLHNQQELEPVRSHFTSREGRECMSA